MNTEEKLVAAMGGIVELQAHAMGLGRPRQTDAERLLKSADFAAFTEKKSNLLTLKTAITRTGAAADPLVDGAKPFIDQGVRLTPTIRQLLPQYAIAQGAVELPVKTATTNNAGVQVGGSPEAFENVALGESSFTFTSSMVPVRTLGHFVPISNQIFEDSGTLQAFIEGELLAGLAEAVEDQLLNGSGSNGELTGLIQGATAYARTSPLTFTTRLDVLRDAIKQVQVSKFRPNAVIVSPTTWRDIELSKDSGNSYQRDPMTSVSRVWGLPVIPTTSIADGVFLVGDLSRAASLFAREAAQVAFARSDSSNFQKNMVTAKATERLALVVTNGAAMRYGSF